MKRLPDASTVARAMAAAAGILLLWLLFHPPQTGVDGAGAAASAPPPSLVPVTTRLAGGDLAAAVHLAADLVRRHPGLADRGGALETSVPLRELVLSRWKDAVDQAADREQTLRDVRFLQRRLAGGCS